ncbi:hypothetical protein BaRGS_00022375 [Batillaria attramentaria]|uniref:Uncharacterized protein n=1 Tax=Batillaria attramentaria TaxID=370345 RepID=A0ABD0KGV2_9CAEN
MYRQISGKLNGTTRCSDQRRLGPLPKSVTPGSSAARLSCRGQSESKDELLISLHGACCSTGLISHSDKNSFHSYGRDYRVCPGFRQLVSRVLAGMGKIEIPSRHKEERMHSVTAAGGELVESIDRLSCGTVAGTGLLRNALLCQRMNY